MTAFRSGVHSVATVPAAPERIWAVLTKSELIAELTPLVDRIEQRGDLWRWTLAGISGLGLEVAPSFTERMKFVPISRIEFRHDPPPGVNERAGVDGAYQITKIDDTTSKLAIELELCVELPLPSFGRRAVEKVMGATMARAGEAFADNLYGHLDIDPSTVKVRTVTFRA